MQVALPSTNNFLLRHITYPLPPCVFVLFLSFTTVCIVLLVLPSLSLTVVRNIHCSLQSRVSEAEIQISSRYARPTIAGADVERDDEERTQL